MLLLFSGRYQFFLASSTQGLSESGNKRLACKFRWQRGTTMLNGRNPPGEKNGLALEHVLLVRNIKSSV